MSHPTTSCEHRHEALSAWVDGELEPPEIEEVEAHLASCDTCRRRATEAERLRRRSLLRPATSQLSVDSILEGMPTSAARPGRSLVARAAAVAAVLVAGTVGWHLATGPGGAGNEDVATIARSAVVRARQASFDRDTVAVRPGDRVEWVNASGVAHHLVMEVGSATVEGNLRPGEADVVTFAAPGDYRFRCTIHESMSGMVTVRS